MASAGMEHTPPIGEMGNAHVGRPSARPVGRHSLPLKGVCPACPAFRPPNHIGTIASDICKGTGRLWWTHIISSAQHLRFWKVTPPHSVFLLEWGVPLSPLQA